MTLTACALVMPSSITADILVLYIVPAKPSGKGSRRKHYALRKAQAPYGAELGMAGLDFAMHKSRLDGKS